ncbi:MAG TPA: hypothetical protein ENJ18_10320 [Nannocystis exedens]|nr:hypothetical protein [Nannocystis exedens]
MTIRDLRSLSKTRCLTSAPFVVSSQDLAAHVESTFLGDIVGSCEECLTPGSIVGEVRSWSSIAPPPLLVGRAIAALCGASPLVHATVTVQVAGRPKSHLPGIVGEPLIAYARVRARSQWRPDLCYLTLDVSIRRPQGGEVLSFELALELRPAAVDAA